MDFRQVEKIISTSQIPEAVLEEGIRIKIISGHLANIRGPMDENTTNMEYLEVSLPPKTHWQHRIPADHAGFIHVLKGEITSGGKVLTQEQLGFYSPGDHVEFKSGKTTGRFLLISSRILQ